MGVRAAVALGGVAQKERCGRHSVQSMNAYGTTCGRGEIKYALWAYITPSIVTDDSATLVIRTTLRLKGFEGSFWVL
jgi:hypothetical protein